MTKERFERLINEISEFENPQMPARATCGGPDHLMPPDFLAINLAFRAYQKVGSSLGEFATLGQRARWVSNCATDYLRAVENLYWVQETPEVIGELVRCVRMSLRFANYSCYPAIRAAITEDIKANPGEARIAYDTIAFQGLEIHCTSGPKGWYQDLCVIIREAKNKK